MKIRKLIVLIVLQLFLFAPIVFANHQGGGSSLVLGIGLPVGFDSTGSNASGSMSDPDSYGGYKLFISPSFLPVALAYTNITADYDQSTNTSVQGTEKHTIYEIVIRIPLGEFGMGIGLGVGTVAFSSDDSTTTVEDSNSTAYSVSLVTPPLVGPVLLVGGLGVIDASDSDVKTNGTQSGTYNASATIPYLGIMLAF